MSIKKKISLSFGAMIILMIICSLLILWQLNNIEHTYSSTIDEGLPQIETTNNIEKEIILIGSQIQTYILGNKDVLEELETSRDNIALYIGDLSSMLPSKEDQAQLVELENKVGLFYEKVDRVISMVESGASKGAGTFYVTSVKPTRNDAVETSSALSEKSGIFKAQNPA